MNELKFGSKVVFLNGLPFTAPTATSDPGSAVAGDVYYNTTSNTIRYFNGSVWSSISSGGTVTSVTVQENDGGSNIFSNSGNPITTSGTINFTLVNQSANTVFAGPTTGSATTPTFRSLVSADIPSLTATYATVALNNLVSPSLNVDLNFNSHKGTNLLDPTNPQDAATKNYVDSFSAFDATYTTDPTAAGLTTGYQAKDHTGASHFLSGFVNGTHFSNWDSLNDDTALFMGQKIGSQVAVMTMPAPVGDTTSPTQDAHFGSGAITDPANNSGAGTGYLLVGSGANLGLGQTGEVFVQSGPIQNTGNSANTGTTEITTGDTSGTGNSGNLNLNTGNANGAAYTFTVTAANATAGATYTNNGFTYTVQSTITGGTSLSTVGTGAPTASGTLTKSAGAGDATITFSAFSAGAAGVTGDINLVTGNSAGATRGIVSINSKNVTIITDGAGVLLNGSNLTDTGNVVPDSDNARNLGSTSKGYATGYIHFINDQSDVPFLEVGNHRIDDINGAVAIDLSSATDRLFKDASGATQITLNASGVQLTSANLDFNSHKGVNLTDPTSPQDAATKFYVDNAIAGLQWKNPARLASTGSNINLAAPGSTLDSVSFVSGDRFLAKDQTAPAQNGIYIWNGAATPATRSTDMSTWAEVVGAVLLVTEGTVNQGSKWVNSNIAGGTLGTTAITFVTFSVAGTVNGTGTTNYVAYWSGTSTLTAEQFLSPTRGGLGTDASGFTGVVKAASGVFSASTIVDADVSATAAIAFSKLAALTSAHILVGNGSNVATDVAVSGDLTLANTGAFTVAKIQGTTVSGTTGSGNVVFSASPTLTGTITAAAANLSGALGANGGITSTGALLVNANAGASAFQLESSTFQRSTDGTNFITEKYVDSTTLTDNSGPTAVTAFQFAVASFAGEEISYVIESGDANADRRVGTLRVTANSSGTIVPSLSDMYTESADCGVTWTATNTGGTISVKYTTTNQGADRTMRADLKQFRA